VAGVVVRELWGRAVAVRLLGSEEMDGAACDVVSLLRPDLPAWFRLWVGKSDGLVRREQMLTEGHLMDHHYAELNAPLDIAPRR
jgi:hypothetical protein